MSQYRQALKKAFPYTIPVLTGLRWENQDGI